MSRAFWAGINVLVAMCAVLLVGVMLPGSKHPDPVVPLWGPPRLGYYVEIDTVGTDVYLVTVHDRVRNVSSETVYLTLGQPVRRLTWTDKEDTP